MGEIRAAAFFLAKSCTPLDGTADQDEDVVESQDMLRDVRELLLGHQIRAAAPNVHAVAKALYGVVRRACASNTANQRACANNTANQAILREYIPQMTAHLPCDVGAFDANVQVYSSSRQLLEAL
ncbi:hypothetical protein T484DRAFT_1906665, partial [Baffinella frigidus]